MAFMQEKKEAQPNEGRVSTGSLTHHHASPKHTLSLMHCVLLTTLVLGLGALVAYIITKDSIVLSWVTGMVGTAFGTAIGAGAQPKN